MPGDDEPQTEARQTAGIPKRYQDQAATQVATRSCSAQTRLIISTPGGDYRFFCSFPGHWSV
ncbi:MAG: hypothetical protein ACLFS2_10035, partial [Halochromatium sp.]|uniref:hypothetical protein n=1 Tax=Halochromatium sp. TaxID=2049430 RepID=UPI0039794009